MARELFLIDGNSLAYRAFFALPETIATSRGEPTNAIFGFASMLVKILTEYGATPTLVVWDGGLSGREVVYEEYKAQRRKRPDLLQEQWPHLAPLVEAMGYVNVKVSGFEADDVIATLAGRASREGFDVMVVTGDRDAFQLVEDGVRIMATSRGITETKIYDREGVLERYGVPPELIPDFIGLKGDTSDNIPGVPGIGEKTAAQLLQRFGDLEGVLGSIDEISGAKRKENLTNHAQDARVSRQIAVAIRDVEVDVDLDRVAASEPDRSRLREYFRRFELRDPLRRLEEGLGSEEAAAPPEAPEVEISVTLLEVPVTGLGELGDAPAALATERPGEEPEPAEAVSAEAGEVGRTDGDGSEADPEAALAAEAELEAQAALDPEAGPDPALDPQAALDLDVSLDPDAGLDPDAALDPDAGPTQAPRRRAADPTAPLRFAAYDGGERVLAGDAESLGALAHYWGGRPVVAHDWKTMAATEPRFDAASAPPLAHDTMVAAYLLDPAGRRYPLDELVAREGIGVNVDSGAADSAGDGVARRAVLVHALAERQEPFLEEMGLVKLFHEVELPLVEVLIEMQRVGLRLDPEALARIGASVDERIATLEDEIHELAGDEFTIGSPQQLAEVLFVKLGLSRKRRGKTGFSTDARVLQAIRGEHPIIAKVESWRELSKLKSTYMDALPELIDPDDARLHTTFNQTATTTGRLSSTDPNLQNIPIRTELGREIRACFVADAGNSLISADYSQVELRVLAHIAGEDVLKDIFRRGEDVHAATAGEIFGIPAAEVDPGTRSRAKMVNFGIVYGLSAYGLADRLAIPQEEAAEFIERYLGRFPKVRDFMAQTIERATDEGYVTTLFGRIRRIPELRARQYQTRLLGERLAVNTVIQGTAADIIKVAMVNCFRALREAGLSTRLVLQIHDELLFEAPEEEIEAASEIVRREMTGAFVLDPPLGVDVGVGPNWLAAK